MQLFPKISTIIVAYNEELLIERIIEELQKQDYRGESEILLADGGSEDSTVALVKAKGIKVVVSSQKGKAYQMNETANTATGDILFFVHADMTFSEHIFSSIAETIHNQYVGGGFANKFDSNNKKIKQLGNLVNLRVFDKREQSDKGIFYGDNGIFVTKKAFKALNGFREIPIMEDYDFSKRLRQSYKTIKINNPNITVSARRHIKAGFIKTRLQWVIIRRLFEWGVSPDNLVKLYKDVR